MDDLRTHYVIALKSYHDTYVSHYGDALTSSNNITASECWVVTRNGNKIAFSNTSGYQLGIENTTVVLNQSKTPFYWKPVEIPMEIIKFAFKGNGQYLSFHDDGSTTLKDWIREWEWFEVIPLCRLPQINDCVSIKTSYGEFITLKKDKITQTSIESDAKWKIRSEIPGSLGFEFSHRVYLAICGIDVTTAFDLLENEHFQLILHGKQFRIRSGQGTFLSAYEDGSIVQTEDPDEHALFTITIY
jgi:hypothetical protein